MEEVFTLLYVQCYQSHKKLSGRFQVHIARFCYYINHQNQLKDYPKINLWILIMWLLTDFKPMSTEFGRQIYMYICGFHTLYKRIKQELQNLWKIRGS